MDQATSTWNRARHAVICARDSTSVHCQISMNGEELVCSGSSTVATGSLCSYILMSVWIWLQQLLPQKSWYILNKTNKKGWEFEAVDQNRPLLNLINYLLYKLSANYFFPNMEWRPVKRTHKPQKSTANHKNYTWLNIL